MTAIANKNTGIQQKSSTDVDFEGVQRLLKAETSAVDSLILDRLSSDVVLINQLGAYIINSGGKRLRPMIVLLSALASGYQGDKHIMKPVYWSGISSTPAHLK
jgi:octaprenyl-diphosphate synthase